MPDPIFRDDKGWYFCDETWSDWLGPFRSKENASIGLEIYYQQLNGAQPKGDYPDLDKIFWASSKDGYPIHEQQSPK